MNNNDNDIKEVKNVLRMIIKHIRPDGGLSPFSYNEIIKLSQIAIAWREEETERGKE